MQWIGIVIEYIILVMIFLSFAVWMVRVENKLDNLITYVRKGGEELMSMADDLLQDVADLPSLNDSLDKFLTNLQAQLNAAIVANDPVKLQAVRDALATHKARILADIKDNTAAAATP